jgi:inosine-uridine nucleoside N-ribohydrolase
VDDGFALAAVLCSRGVRVLGVSAVAGNTDSRSALVAIAALLDAAGAPHVPVVGAEQASEAMAALRQGAEILALGPLTNVAGALAKDPHLADRTGLRLVSRVLRPARHPLLTLLDLNRRKDPQALGRCLEKPWARRRVFPLDVVRRLTMGAEDLLSISETGRLGAYLAEHSWRWLRRARLRHLAASFPAWDLVPALDLVGDLPRARFGDDGWLNEFDPAAAKSAFLERLRTAADRTPGPLAR